jgi:hypothetical protein
MHQKTYGRLTAELARLTETLLADVLQWLERAETALARQKELGVPPAK